ncbi:MAG: hypothetical protein HRU19_24300 [Pseudobacteriovorax sp.]|nr:hypothetical protein [Pseudobacteriovorax sp.]
MKVERNSIYLIPPRYNLTVADGRLNLSEQHREKGLNLPIDIFFNSLAKESQEKAIAIILSGTGSDGANGVKKIFESGGLVLCQSLESAKFDGMPKSAIATNTVHKVMHPNKMGAYIESYRKALASQAPNSLTNQKNNYSEIFALLSKKFHVDFGVYKRTTINRRIERRIQALMINSLKQYTARLNSDDDELRYLFDDLLISVTSFFRDPEIFDYIYSTVIPRLFESNRQTQEIRIWVPGCASGEEAYTLAILLKEYSDKIGVRYDIKIFASDINKKALSYANVGTYSESQVFPVGKERLEKFFKPKGDHYTIVNEIRNLIVFAPQNLLTDPPFTRVDMISCRSLMIYIQPEIQEKLIGTFHFPLNVMGFFFLVLAKESVLLQTYLLAPTTASRFLRKQKIQGLPRLI